MGVLAACPTDDLAPLIAWMAERIGGRRLGDILTSIEFYCR